jgi:hypothetical protein
MKVRAIETSSLNGITRGKIYEVIDSDGVYYKIINDEGIEWQVFTRCFEVVEEDSSYSSLKRVLDMAYDQASSGKGKERHANNDTFESQPICQIPRYQGSIDFVTGQAIKKCLEVTKLPTVDAKVRELLGAINYIAAGIIVLQEGSNDGN